MAIFKGLLLALSLAATGAVAQNPEVTCGPAQVITYVPPPLTLTVCTKTITVPVPSGGPPASTYTTFFPAFCPSGTCDVTYVVTEVVHENVPETKSCGGVPRGFKTDVITYLGEGNAQVTTTICYPHGGSSVVPWTQAKETCASCQKHSDSHKGGESNSDTPVKAESVKISPAAGYVVTFLAVLFLL